MVGARSMLALLLLASSGCPGADPLRKPPEVTGASVTLRGAKIAVEWLRSDPDRRQPIGRRDALAEDQGVLCGWTRERILHFFSESDAAFDVAFLAADGAILEIQPLPAQSTEGITSRKEARRALFLREGWLVRHGAKLGDRVSFSPEIFAAPADPMPEVKVGGVTVSVETSHLSSERMRGLMHRRTMSADDGMLFIYPAATSRSFWMAHCHYGLDIAFFGTDRKLLNVVSIDPYPDPTVDSGERAPSDGPAQFVLEVHKGWFMKKGLVDAAGKPAWEVRIEMPAAVENLKEYAE